MGTLIKVPLKDLYNEQVGDHLCPECGLPLNMPWESGLECQDCQINFIFEYRKVPWLTIENPFGKNFGLFRKRETWVSYEHPKLNKKPGPTGKSGTAAPIAVSGSVTLPAGGNLPPGGNVIQGNNVTPTGQIANWPVGGSGMGTSAVGIASTSLPSSGFGRGMKVFISGNSLTDKTKEKINKLQSRMKKRFKNMDTVIDDFVLIRMILDGKEDLTKENKEKLNRMWKAYKNA